MKLSIYTLVFLICAGTPMSVSAAQLSFMSKQTEVPLSAPFEIAVMLDTAEEVNAIGTVIRIPSSLRLLHTSDGNSIISLWVERPAFDAVTRTLSFSGIMPNGYRGQGKLLVLTLAADSEGAARLSFESSQTIAYQNGPDAPNEPITVAALTLHASSGTPATLEMEVDRESPEAFVPVLARTPSLYDGAWTLSYATQDKGSGIVRYEVSESSFRMTDTNRLVWTRAESPYVLHDQSLRKYVYVRAVDGQGNARIALYTPSLFSRIANLATGILIVILILFALWLRFRPKRSVHATL